MISEINIEDYLEASDKLPLVDVRSPVEFNKGHIAGAFNIPLFTDEERARVGTSYIRQSKEEALRLAYQYINPKLSFFVEKSREIAPQNKIAVHCRRGGMRSHAFAEHLNGQGFEEVFVINRGYKAFRNFAHQSFYRDARLIIIGGYTGSGKTNILKCLHECGLQVIDLEGLAHHKGSVFGGIGNNISQPTVEQFENNLFAQWNKMDFSKPVLLEDESHKIGSVEIPINLYHRMNKGKVLFLDIPKEARAVNLVAEYANCNKTELAAAIKKISKRLGDLNTRTAIDLLEKENFYEVAMLALNYYDKAYIEMLSGRERKQVQTVKLDSTDVRRNAEVVKLEVSGL